MDKYYVRCGELETIVLANSPENAARQSIIKAQGETLWYFFYIDEKGFRGPAANPLDNSYTFDTEFLPQWVIPYEEIVCE